MKRRLFNLAALVSALLLVATIASWGSARLLGTTRSVQVTSQSASGAEPDGSWSIYFGSSRPAGFLFYVYGPRSRGGWWVPPLRGWYCTVESAGAAETWTNINANYHAIGAHTVGGIAWYSDAIGSTGFRREVFISYTTLALLTVLVPMMWAVGSWQHICSCAKGHCPTCRYDLRESPDRCPECGTYR